MRYLFVSFFSCFLFFFFPLDNELYIGTDADFSGNDPIIYREPLQTDQYDSLSLNGEIWRDSAAVNDNCHDDKNLPFSAPNFVGSFTFGDFVYFLIRETAVEFINCGKVRF
jgi:hypothetical protein